MPYKLDGLCVVRADTGETVKCHKTKAQALAHLRALEVNVPEAKSMMMLTQAETNYNPAGGVVNKACSNCRWFCPPDDGMETMCHLVSDDPAPIVANGLCDRWEGVPQAVMTPPEPIPVTIVESDDSMEMALPATRRGLVDIIKDVVKSLTEPTPEPVFSVFKALNGKKYWLARHTGKWIDREQEIITNQAHEDYVARVQKGLVPLPELWIWHKKGTRHGQADMVWKSGGFVLALGHFDDTPEADKAYRFYEKNRGKIKLSHMFHYPKRAKQGRVFSAYNTVEITTLPDGAEAFPYTSFEELSPMLTDNQKEFIKSIGGDEMLSRVESADTKALSDTSALEKQGVASKGLENFEGSVLPTDKDIEALKAQTAEIETKLKGVESVPGQVEVMGKMIKAQNDLIGQMQKTVSDALAKSNALEKQLLEYQAVAPPATQSKDTILNEREKSVIEQALEQAKTENTPSLIDMAMGIRPAANP